MNNIFDKVSPYRSNISMKLLQNDRVCKLLTYMKPDKLIDDMPSVDNPFDLYQKRIFKRTSVEGIVEEEACYLMMQFPYFTKNKTSPRVFMDSKLVFTIFCHKNVIDVLEGDRVDLLVSELSKMFDGNRDFGFMIGSPTVQEITHKQYYGATVIFELTDFKENG